MFSWNIAKSMEAMFYRRAIKHVCKFFLKKKLGELILGDIDIDQLEVQLLDGTIHLTDIALNTDFLNKKLGISPIICKEGSIGSLSVRIPWNDTKRELEANHFQIEVCELEIVLSPCHERGKPIDVKPTPDEVNELLDNEESIKFRREAGSGSVCLAIHEGVKKVARMVQWLLTNFSMKIKNVIVAFEPSLDVDMELSDLNDILVLRISEIELVSCFSEEDSNSPSDLQAGTFLDLSRLTNFMKFRGVQVEFLHMGCSVTAIPLLTGENGGFLGTVKMSMPWENGIPDLRKIDADIVIDPAELRLQPTTISWILHIGKHLNSLACGGRSTCHEKTSNSLCHTCSFHSHPSSSEGLHVTMNEMIMSNTTFSSNLFNLTSEEVKADTSLPAAHLISNWVPLFDELKLGVADDSDHMTSIENFFECFEELRSSQAALGSSKLWNWTCSFLTAIAAASNLASGSVHSIPEQQNASMTLKAKVGGITFVLSFCDDHEVVHCLEAKCMGLCLAFEICSLELRFEALLEHFMVDDYIYNGHKASQDDFGGYDILYMNAFPIYRLQTEVQHALPPLHFPTCDFGVDKVSISGKGIVKVPLLRSLNDVGCRTGLTSTYSVTNAASSTSLSFFLPPLISWISLYLVDVVSDLFKKVDNSIMKCKTCTSACNHLCVCNDVSPDGVSRGSYNYASLISSKGNIRGNISFSTTRLIVCFPFLKEEYRLQPMFIGLDLSSSSGDADSFSALCHGSEKGLSNKTSCSVMLDFGDLSGYLITSCKSGGELVFSAKKVVSFSRRTNHCCNIGMFWQDGIVTGPWIAKKAWALAKSRNPRSASKVIGKGYDFTSVTVLDDTQHVDSYVQQEMLLSSAFWLHTCFPVIRINLDVHDYQQLYQLLKQFMDALVNQPGGLKAYWVDRNKSDGVLSDDKCLCQSSVLIECEEVNLCIDLDVTREAKGFFQRELPGSWSHLCLNIQKFESLIVSNIGGIRSATFSRISHGNGEVWGSISEEADDFLLISCSKYVAQRGDGEGTNAMFSGCAGIIFIHLSEPHVSKNFTSLTISCVTIFAPGGRLDWVVSACCFFDSICQGQDVFQNMQNEFRENSLFLDMVDVALSYEPLDKNSVVREGSDSGCEQCASCILACALFSLSNKSATGSLYQIQLHDIGFLLSHLDGKHMDSICCMNDLRKMGYVKIAGETLMEAILRTRSIGGILWELELADSYINLDTYHDTTAALISLISHIQDLFAPDVEESVAHLQTKCNVNVQEPRDGHDITAEGIKHYNKSPMMSVASPLVSPSGDKIKDGVMGEICEDGIRNGGINWHTSVTAETQVFHAELPNDISGSDSGGLKYDLIKPAGILKSSSSHLAGVSCERMAVSNAALCGLMDEIVDDAFYVKTNYVSHASFLSENDIPNFVGQTEYANGSISVNTAPLIDCPLTTNFIEAYYQSEMPVSMKLSQDKQYSNIAPNQEMYVAACPSVTVGKGDGWYVNSQMAVVENHISNLIEHSHVDQESNFKSLSPDSAPQLFPPRGHVILRNINIRWRMYDGFHWAHSRMKHGRLADTDERNSLLFLVLTLSGINLSYNLFPVGDRRVSILSLSVMDVCLCDERIDAPWRKVLGCYDSKNHPRKSGTKAFRFELEAVRPDPLTPLEEYRLSLAFLPIRLHLDQCQLDFLISFFAFKSPSIEGCPASKFGGLQGTSREALLPFFQKFDIWPSLVCVDYNPHHIDVTALRGGSYAEIINLLSWKGIELQLRHVSAVGVHGWSCICEAVLEQWSKDILQNQVHKILEGLVPVKSLVTVSSGAAKLVSLPLRSYEDHHKLLKGIQRGAIALSRNISLEAVGLGMHLAVGVHEILLKMESLLMRNQPSLPLSTWRTIKKNARSDQPKNAQEGFQQAYECLSNGLGIAASALVGKPMKTYQRGGAGSAVAVAVRAAPAAAIAPAAAAANAIHCTLAGVRNSLKQELRKE